MLKIQPLRPHLPGCLTKKCSRRGQHNLLLVHLKLKNQNYFVSTYINLVFERRKKKYIYNFHFFSNFEKKNLIFWSKFRHLLA